MPATVAQLAQQDTMNDYGRKLFYVNHPQITSKADFASNCPSGGEQTIVLGCYHGGQSGIYVLDVNDPRLDGVEQVTAAHEMLHAAYERLSSSDKAKVDKMLEDYYKNDLKDQRILDVIDSYKKSEPNDVVNEMHSVFGSEIANLPAPLEAYYKRYFTNRAQVAAFAERYQSEFTSRQATIDQYDAQLAALKSRIEAGESDIKDQQANIDSQRAALMSLNNSDPSSYNASVPAYNRLIDAYNYQVSSIQNLIAQYNQLVETRNAVALEANQLSKSLSSDVAPISKN